jgi:HlyD family secretion protein
MSKILEKSNRKWILAGVLILVAGFLVFRFWSARKNKLPEGFASGNGRIEADLVDVAAKEPLRVQEVLVKEGDLVRPGQVLVRLNTETMQAELAEAKAKVAAVQQNVGVANAAITSRKSEISLAQTEEKRSGSLVKQGAGSQRELDVRQKNVQTSTAGLSEDQARLGAAQKDVETARASVATIETRIKDATLVSPVVGRVLYRLAEPGEVVAAGGKALTLVDLSDVYMEIFLPSDEAASLKMGAEGRIQLDYLPDYTVPARVTFVSPEAQFTPKQVETKSEREMLMFRVKLQVPQDLVLHYVEQIKTGVRGVGYVKVDPSAHWPQRFSNLLTVDQSMNRAAMELPPASEEHPTGETGQEKAPVPERRTGTEPSHPNQSAQEKPAPAEAPAHLEPATLEKTSTPGKP